MERGPPKPALLWLAGAVCFSPALACLLFIRAHAVNLPTGDEWDAMVPAMVSLADGDFPWREVFQQDNEHRLVLPHLVQLALAHFTHYDNRFELYFGWCCLLGTSLLFFFDFLRERGLSSRTLLVFFPVNLVLFTWRQSENLILAYQINVLLAVFLAVLTFFLLRQPTRVRLAFAATSAVGATYSHLLGLVVFPIGALELLRTMQNAPESDRPLAKRRLAAWLSVGGLSYAAYGIGYHATSYNPSLTYALSHPWVGLGFLLSALAAPWAIDPVTALATGALLAAGYALALADLRRHHSKTLLAPAVLLSVGAAVLVAIGRSGFRDLGSATALRYTSYATPGVAALYLWALSRSSLPRARVVLSSWLVVGFVATPSATALGLAFAREQTGNRKAVAEGLVSHRVLTDDDLAKVCPWNPSQIRIQAAALERVGWSIFRGAPSAPAPILAGKTEFTIDVVNDVPTTDAGPIPVQSSDVVVAGWAVDEPAHKPAGGVRVCIDGREVAAAYGFDRDDVAKALETPEYRFSGFRAVFPRASIRPGRHRLSVEIDSFDRRGRYVAPSAVEIEVGP